jgi:arginyl-tRNA synthetase
MTKVINMNFKLEAARIIHAALQTSEVNAEDVLNEIGVPVDSEKGDYAFKCFRFSKILGKPPVQIADDIAVKADSFDRLHCFGAVKAESAYVNFYINKELFAETVVSDILAKGGGYCASDIGGGKVIVMDYSSPNIAKRMHIGHLYSTVIGAALNRIYTVLGYKVVGINYLGDYGTQFGKLITAFLLWGSEEAVERDGVEELERIYVKFHVEVESNPALEDDARQWMLKMEQGDGTALRLWERFKDISIKVYDKMYARLGVPFDLYQGESHYRDKMDAVVDELRNKGLLVKSQGASIVDLEAYKMPPCLILRTDGGTLYHTRDIAAALDRMSTHDFHKSLYVTDLRQNLNFAQLFKVVELMGYEWAKDMVHVPYGLLSFDGDNLSSRKGNVLILEKLFDQAAEKVLGIINEKNPDLPNKDFIAEKVGTGAIVFGALYNSRVKDVTFSWDRIFAFDGETGPYVQYTHARCASIIERAAADSPREADLTLLNDKLSFELIKLLYHFPQKIVEAAERYEPYIISRALMEIVAAFNRFYHENPVLKAEPGLRAARLCLVKCTKDIISEGLRLLGVYAPNQM